MDKDREYRVLGNNVTTIEKPIRKEEQKRSKELERLKRNRRVKERRIAKDKRKTIIEISAMIFITGFITISGNSALYSMQKEISQINGDIKEMKSSNEALSLKLLKVEGLDNIKSIAEGQLGMVKPDNTAIINSNLSYNNFSSEEIKGEGLSLIDKIKDALF